MTKSVLSPDFLNKVLGCTRLYGKLQREITLKDQENRTNEK